MGDEDVIYISRPYKSQPRCPNCGYLLVLKMTNEGLVRDVDSPWAAALFDGPNPAVRSYLFTCPSCYDRIELTINATTDVWSYSLT